MQIRKATANDVKIIAPLFDAYRMFYKQQTDLPAAEKFIAERFENNESVIFLATDNDGNAIGFTQLYPVFSSVSMRRTLLLNDLYVDENMRGQGIAALLLNAAKQYAKEAGCKWLLLETASDNYTAQSLYIKNGWERVDDFFYQVNV